MVIWNALLSMNVRNTAINGWLDTCTGLGYAWVGGVYAWVSGGCGVGGGGMA